MSNTKEKLYKKFEDIPSRRGRGGTYQYVRWQDVADRMNEVFGSRWSSEVVYQDIVGKNIIVRVSVCIKDPDTGDNFCQEGYGGAVNDDNQDAGNPFKAAYSKALKDACKKWGVGLYLEEESETNESSYTNDIPVGYMAKEYGVPPKDVVSAPPIEVPTPPPMFFKEEEPIKEDVENEKAKEVAAPTIKKVNDGGFPPIPPSYNSVKENEPEKVEIPSKYNTIKLEVISDVQKVALHSILKRLNIEYSVLVKEAFEANGLDTTDIPDPDSLTYQQAVHVVRYGNEKFRG